jgi:ribokinase
MPDAILVAGSANLDFVVRAAHVPAPGETVLGREFVTFPGGKGANQAVACARTGGASTRMLLALGDDTFAAPIEASLRAADVDLHIVRTPTATGTAFICVADNAENAITVAPGANAALRAEHLPPLAGTGHLLLQLETPIDVVTAYALAARRAKVNVVLNAAPARELPPELLATLDVLIVNEGELAAITGVRGNIAQALSRLSVPCVVVTLGERGACISVRGRFHLQPAFHIEPVDTTAAGDTFCGAFTAALGASLDLPHALERACAASALACTRMGAQSSIPTRSEVDEFLAARAADVRNGERQHELAAYCGIDSPA